MPGKKQTLAAYGTWKSPIDSKLIAGKTLRLGQPRLFDETIYWVESRPLEKGRSVLVKCARGGKPVDVTPAPFSAQTYVNGYGGGVYTVYEDRVWFVEKSDRAIYEITSREEPKKIFQQDGMQFADLRYDPQRKRIICIGEHDDNQRKEPENFLAAIDIQTGNLAVLHSGYDFYSSPRVNKNNDKLAWLAWDHPNMPWDGTDLLLADIDETGELVETRRVAGGKDEAIFQPEWLNAEELVYVSDRSNWWNLYRWNGTDSEALTNLSAEFGLPHWVFGMSVYGFIDESTIACAWTADGVWHAGTVNLANKELRKFDLPYNNIEHLHANEHGIAMLAGSAANPNSIVGVDAETKKPQVVRSAAAVKIDAGYISPAQAVAFPTGIDDTAYGLYYAPQNPEFAGHENELPPLLVKCHGGPTSATSGTLDLKIQYWTSRGFAVLDVNYRGSTGYGRDYRRKLYGQWGVFDVEDCINGAKFLAGQGLADPERMLISGSSAGGYTVLCALTFHDVFAAGASYYGIGELKSAMMDTEKFESRYGESLIGPPHDAADLWRARSPLYSAEKLSRPVIFFQGMEDEIVLPDQAERMVSAMRNNGIAVAYIAFPGEGHGFRQGDTIQRAIDSELYFYGKILGFEPAGELPEVCIENLS